MILLYTYFADFFFLQRVQTEEINMEEGYFSHQPFYQKGPQKQLQYKFPLKPIPQKFPKQREMKCFILNSRYIILIMSMISPHKIDSKPVLTKLVETKMLQKYNNPFSFYRVKPINEMLYGQYHNKTYIDLCDIRTLSEETQFMRRLYYYRTMTGRQQLIPRIKMCCEYYSKNRILSHEYPMMMVTNTKTLFLKRNKRLKKILAGEASSDYSEEEEEELFMEEFDKEDILDELQNSSLDDLQSNQGFQEVLYDDEVYDIFGQDVWQEEELYQINLRGIKESDVAALIVDMSQPKKDPIPQQQLFSMKLPPLNSQPLQNIQNKQPHNESQSISITPIEPNPLKQSITFLKKSVSSSMAIDRKQKKSVDYTNLYNNFDTDNEIYDLFRSNRESLTGRQSFTGRESITLGNRESITVDTLKQSVDNQQLQMEQRRRKIREKAEELLQRVKKQSCGQNEG